MCGCTKDLCFTFFTLLLDVVTELVRKGVLRELLYADGLVLKSETIEGLRNKFLKWKEAFESKRLQANLGKTKVMASGGNTKNGMPKSTVDPCGVCSFRIKVNSVMCLHCDNLIHGRCPE